MMRDQHPVNGTVGNDPDPNQPTVTRKKRSSKYDIPAAYESSPQPLFVSFPGQSQCCSSSSSSSFSKINTQDDEKVKDNNNNNNNKPLTEGKKCFLTYHSINFL